MRHVLLLPKPVLAARHVYATTPASEEGLRGEIMTTFADTLDYWVSKTETKELFTEFGDLAYDVLFLYHTQKYYQRSDYSQEEYEVGGW